MKLIVIKKSAFFMCCLFAMLLIASCNKPLEEATPIIYPPVNNDSMTIADLISSDTSYSFFAAAAKKVGQLAQLGADNTEFTVFLPNNNAFRASGIPSVAVVNSLPAQTLAGIVGYAVIPGRQFLSSGISTSFPNEQLPTSIKIGTLPGTPIPLNLTTFPSVSSTGFYDNNIPVVKSDLKVKNGVVHLVAGIVAPPSQVLKTAIYNNPDLAYFKAAIARADSGQVGLNRIDSLLGYAVTNMTVLAPDNQAFQTLLFGIIYSSLLQQGMSAANASQTATLLSSSPTVFSNPLLFGSLPATTVRGILVYHFLATPNPNTGAYEPNVRVFSNNFSSIPSFYKTLLNSAIPQHPGIMVNATFSGPFVSNLTFTGLGTFPPGGAPFSGAAANAVSMDNNAVNGVYYVIDKVLLPQ
jgi:uncharacterized surface protein with fasciclin (FAS1) repeats